MCVGKEEPDSGVGGEDSYQVCQEGRSRDPYGVRKGLWQVCWEGRSHHRCVQLGIMTSMLEREESYHMC